MTTFRIVLFYFIQFSVSYSNSENYWKQRDELIHLEESKAKANLKLNAKETEVNQILMRYKLQELDDAFIHPEKFLPAINFFQSKSHIEKSKIFQIIRQLPKGSSLHSHGTALVSEEYLYNLTYSKGLQGCITKGRLLLHFLPHMSKKFCSPWKLVENLRQENSSFDRFLKTQISLVTPDPAQSYPNVNIVWKRFEDTFDTVKPMLKYSPVHKDYFYQALKELYEDNVMYLEFRSGLAGFYDHNSEEYSQESVVSLYIEALKEFKEDYKDFHGARAIYAPYRNVSNNTMLKYVHTAIKLRDTYPKFVAGFDLVGQEDKGKPLVDFIPYLQQIGKKLKFFFHAGETNWNGMTTDLNLVDAVLLNTTRIGHGYALLKHPEVLRIVKERGIAIEVSPISNQVLKLVDDMRNHPASVLMNRGFNVVVCNDDPSFWGARGLSYDWYMAFMGMASRQSDLRFLKQLAMNSILFSAMENEEKLEVLEKWKRNWDEFLDKILSKYKF